MKPTTTKPAQANANQTPVPEPVSRAEEMGVSAAELIELIRSGQGFDVNQLVSRTLDDRRAA